MNCTHSWRDCSRMHSHRCAACARVIELMVRVRSSVCCLRAYFRRLHNALLVQQAHVAAHVATKPPRPAHRDPLYVPPPARRLRSLFSPRCQSCCKPDWHGYYCAPILTQQTAWSGNRDLGVRCACICGVWVKYIHVVTLAMFALQACGQHVASGVPMNLISLCMGVVGA